MNEWIAEIVKTNEPRDGYDLVAMMVKNGRLPLRDAHDFVRLAATKHHMEYVDFVAFCANPAAKDWQRIHDVYQLLRQLAAEKLAGRNALMEYCTAGAKTAKMTYGHFVYFANI